MCVRIYGNQTQAARQLSRPTEIHYIHAIEHVHTHTGTHTHTHVYKTAKFIRTYEVFGFLEESTGIFWNFLNRYNKTLIIVYLAKREQIKEDHYRNQDHTLTSQS